MGGTSSAFHKAAEAGDVNQLRELLDGPNPPHVDSACDTRYKWAPLHYAAWADRREAVEFLLSRGADIERRSGTGWTFTGDQSPLLVAAAKGCAAAADILLAAGADTAARDDSDHTSLHYAAAATGSERLVALLLARGASADARRKPSDTTPLDDALEAGAMENARLILRLCSPETALRALEAGVRGLKAARVAFVCANATGASLPPERLLALRDSMEADETRALADAAGKAARAAESRRKLSELSTSAIGEPNPARKALLEAQAAAEAQRAAALSENQARDAERSVDRRNIIRSLDSAWRARRNPAPQASPQAASLPDAPPITPPAPADPAHAAAPSDPSRPPDLASPCPVCLDLAKDAAIVPCGHLVCARCGELCRASGRGCPVCRGAVGAVMRVYG